MELHLKMWIEGITFDGNFDEVTAFEFVDDGAESTLLCEDKESLLYSLDKCQKIIDAIRESITE